MSAELRAGRPDAYPHGFAFDWAGANNIDTYDSSIDVAPDFESKTLTMHNVRYRTHPGERTVLSVALFYNAHDKLKVTALGARLRMMDKRWRF